MPARRAAPSLKPSPKPSGGGAKEPTREALMAAFAEREREFAEAREQQAALAEVLRVTGWLARRPGDGGGCGREKGDAAL